MCVHSMLELAIAFIIVFYIDNITYRKCHNQCALKGISMKL
uniref:Uncharacterized protein n=1 Tax=Anguilla anguilla TaxID=7936 RepID=A0A0E9RNB0_ANGAN